MTDAHLSLTGFDMAALDRAQPHRPEPRVRLQPKASHALEQGRSRLVVTAAMFAMAFGAISVKLVDATILSRGAEPNVAQAATTRALTSRADILDRNGIVLATSLTTQSLYADPKLIIDPVEAAEQLVKVLPDLNIRDLVEDFSSDKRFVWIKRNLTPRQQYAINALGIPGLAFQKEERRIYPHGNLAAHVVGFTGVDNNGLMGIEQSFDRQLKNGVPLQLSIDVRLQHILRKEMQATIEEFRAVGGAGIIMDVRTGEVLSMVSLPDFDPHAPTGLEEQTRFNRATLGTYEPGSSFKIFNTAMALESGQVRIQDSFDATHPIRVGRFMINDYHPEYRWMDVPHIFKESSNIGSVKMAQRVGIEGQKEFLNRVGMFKPSTVEVPEVAAPTIPRPWREISMMTVAYGHGISVSPMNVATGVSAIVNGGILRPATLLKRGKDDLPGQRVISPQTSDQMRRLMRLVVTDGTAKQAETPGYLIGGKTATAEKIVNGVYVRNARISSFVGAFPMNDPRYVVLAMVDEPKGTKKTFGYATAGWTAAPLVGRVVQQIGPLLGIRPVDASSPEIVHDLAIGTPPRQAQQEPTLVSY